MLKSMGSSLILAATPSFEAANPKSGMEGSASDPYDLLITSGKVIDPSQRISAVMDVALTSGMVARLAPNIRSAMGAR